MVHHSPYRAALGKTPGLTGYASVSASLPNGPVTFAMRGPDYTAQLPNGLSVAASKAGVVVSDENGSIKTLGGIQAEAVKNVFNSVFNQSADMNPNMLAGILNAHASRALSAPQQTAALVAPATVVQAPARPSASTNLTL